MGPIAAVRILHRRKLAEVADDVRPQLEAELAAEHERIAGGVEKAVEIGVVDEIVTPQATRSALARAIRDADTGAARRPHQHPACNGPLALADAALSRPVFLPRSQTKSVSARLVVQTDRGAVVTDARSGRPTAERYTTLWSQRTERRRRRSGRVRARRPRAAEQVVDAVGEVPAAERGGDHGVLEAVLADHDVAVHAGDGVEDPQRRRVGVALRLGRGGGLLGHLEAELLPALQRAGQLGRRAGRTGPGVLGAIGRALDRLRDPVQANGRAEDAAHRPLDVGAQRRRRGVDVQDATGA